MADYLSKYFDVQQCIRIYMAHAIEPSVFVSKVLKLDLWKPEQGYY